jgi:hypothetical protein
MDHVLIKNAKRKPYTNKPVMPNGVRYDKEKGFWVINDSPFVDSDEFKEQQGTKKCDVETGEDQKGE